MDFSITLAQTNPLLGDVGKNLEQHLALARAATADGADLILFPELSLSGYFLRDQVFDIAMPLDAPELDPVRELSRGITIALGLPERARDGRCYNTLAVFEDGELIGKHRKVHLVSYGMFDETRDFAAGETWTPIHSRLGTFGPFLCEDIWHLGGQYIYGLDAVDVLLVASAGPARGVGGAQLDSTRTWQQILSSAAQHAQAYTCWSNRVGFEDGVAFGGGSSIFGPDGKLVADLQGLDEGAVGARLTADELHRVHQRTPLLRDPRPWILETELAKRAGRSATRSAAPPSPQV
jgi:predicted amidohydrolase